jgi:hypothetical protein
MPAANVLREGNSATEVDLQIASMRSKISKAFSSFRNDYDELQHQIEDCTQKYELLKYGKFRIFQHMLRAVDFAQKCHTLVDQLSASAFICQDADAVLAAQMIRRDGAIILIDVVEPLSYRLRWDRLDGSLDPLVQALDRATAGLLSVADAAMATSRALGAKLQEAGLPTILLPEYPPSRPFEHIPGIKAACRLKEADRLILVLDPVSAKFANQQIVACLHYLPDNYHMAIMGSCGDRPAASYAGDLTDYAASQRLRERVHLLPPVEFERFPSFAGSADVGVISPDPTNAAYRLTLPSCLFDCINARLPVAAGDHPDVQQVLDTYSAGRQFDPSEPQSVATAIHSLAQAKAQLLPNIDQAARELTWARNETGLLTLLGGAGTVTIMRTELPANEGRTHRIASTLIDHGIDVTVVTAEATNRDDGSGEHRSSIPGAKYCAVPVDV